MRLWSIEVVTVTTWPGVAPSPDSIFEILSGSVAKAPTISNSGLCGAKAAGADGYFWSISRLDALLNALVSLL
mgnify:CR=1 FL=1